MNSQEAAVEKLSRLKVGALFMAMGTGKTKVALDLIAAKADRIDYILWICPYSLKEEIKRERDKWHPELDLDIVGVESIGQSGRIYMETLGKAEQGKTFIVVDESLKIKNLEAQRTKRVLELGKRSEYRLILNGTPLSRNVLDLWTQMEFLSPKILGMNYREFRDTFTEYYLRGRLKGKVKRQHNIEYLISLIRPYIFDAELELDRHKEYIDHTYRMSIGEELEYADLKMSILSSFNDESNIDFYRLTTALQSYYTEAMDRERVLRNIIDDAEGAVIVFVKYLKSIPDGALRITGEMSGKERNEAIEKLRSGKGRVLWITYGCGSFGLNLQFCHTMIFADHTFDYSMRIQAEARIFRMGQTEDVTYYSLWCDCGLERLIRGSLNKKSNLLTEVKKEIERKGVKEWLRSI